MVGVPGRSKGCSTCRQRKIGCGLQKPACAQCIRSNRVCGGYRRDQRFILVQPGAKTKRSISKDYQPDKEVSSRSRDDDDDSEKNDISNSSSAISNQNQGGGISCCSIERSASSELLSRASSRQSLILTFLASCFPVSKQSHVNTEPWVLLLADFPSKTKALESSAMALATAAVGRVYDNPQFIQESLRLYTQGLRDLQNALWDESLMRQDGTLAACLALSLFEAIECPNNGSAGYVSHCKGIVSLIGARGIDAHTSGIGYRLFSGIRLPVILQALDHQSPNFLSDPIWMVGPWTETPKTPWDRVVDCLARAPAILQKTHLFRLLASDRQAQLAERLIWECLDIDKTLQEIYDEIHYGTTGLLFWPLQSRTSNPSDAGNLEKLFPTAYYFTDLKTAATIALYWATCTMLWSGLCDLYDNIKTNSSNLVDNVENHVSTDDSTDSSNIDVPRSTSRLPPLGHRRDFRPMVHNVCQSVEYFLQDEMMMAGAFLISPALGIVVATLKHQPNYSREVSWLNAALDMVQKKGLRLLAYI